MTQRSGAEGAEVAEGNPNILTERIIGAAVEVHRHLGPGLLESVYEECLSRELMLRGLDHDRQVAVDVHYKGVFVRNAFRVDFLVEDLVPVELKAVEALSEVHQVQLLTYLRVAERKLGLLINFNVPTLWRGVRRVVNNL